MMMKQHLMKQKLLSLRAEVRKKTTALDQMQKTQDIYKERLKVMEGKARNLETTIKQQAKNTLQNKRATTVMVCHYLSMRFIVQTDISFTLISNPTPP